MQHVTYRIAHTVAIPWYMQPSIAFVTSVKMAGNLHASDISRSIHNNVHCVCGHIVCCIWFAVAVGLPVGCHCQWIASGLPVDCNCQWIASVLQLAVDCRWVAIAGDRNCQWIVCELQLQVDCKWVASGLQLQVDLSWVASAN